MKKLVFAAMAMCLFSTSMFANETVKNNAYGIKSKETTEIENCKDRGGNCAVTVITGGVARTFLKCCNDVIIVRL